MCDIHFCSKCGHSLTKKDKFCPYCGTMVLVETDLVKTRAIFGNLDEEEQGTEIGGTQNPPYNNQTQSCYKCKKNNIPLNAKFCPFCGAEFYFSCPKCGRENRAEYTYCLECGTNREEYLKEIEREKQEKEQKEINEHIWLEQQRETELAQQELLTKRRLEELEIYIKKNRYNILEYGYSLVEKNKNTIQSKERQGVLSTIFYVLATLSLIIASCFFKTEYHELSIIIFFVILPFTLLFAIILHNFSRQTSPIDLTDGIRDFIKKSYPIDGLGWHAINSALEKNKIFVSKEEIADSPSQEHIA